VLHLDSRHRLIVVEDLFRGTISSASVHLSELNTPLTTPRFYTASARSSPSEAELRFPEAVAVRPAKAGASSGRQSHRGKSRSPVAWVAGSREIEILKPTDKCHRRMAASHSVVA
jgi:hypothetical protein